MPSGDFFAPTLLATYSSTIQHRLSSIQESTDLTSHLPDGTKVMGNENLQYIAYASGVQLAKTNKDDAVITVVVRPEGTTFIQKNDGLWFTCD